MNPRLFPHRLWLLPMTFASIWHLCTNFCFLDPWLNAYNFTFCTIGLAMVLKLVDIASMDAPPKYDGRAACEKQLVLCGNCVLNTISYSLDPRCLVSLSCVCQLVLSNQTGGRCSTGTATAHVIFRETRILAVRISNFISAPSSAFLNTAYTTTPPKLLSTISARSDYPKATPFSETPSQSLKTSLFASPIRYFQQSRWPFSSVCQS
jgi:hypothetical protein